MREFLLKLFLKKVPRRIDDDYNKILNDHSTYYRNLDSPSQQKFRQRLFILLNVLGFSSAQLPKVTREMRTVIGCAIIEITFGLDYYLPKYFTNIIVMPRRYMYPGYGQPFLGHVDFTKHTIYFSWQDVKTGYGISDDALNVAMHEMAHVLEVENNYRVIFRKFFDKVKWDDWAELAFAKMQVIRSKKNEVLKNYGGANMKEMFAVCIETFFEQPEAFKNNLPELYQSIVELLKQDPTVAGNPRLING